VAIQFELLTLSEYKSQLNKNYYQDTFPYKTELSHKKETRRKLSLFENEVLMRILRPEEKEVKTWLKHEGWAGWTGHIAHTEEIKNMHKIFVEKRHKEDSFGDIDIDGRII
jgi:hypothetical protein